MAIPYSRAYLVIGSLYLLIGIVFGMYMGGTSNYTLAPVHAHINLLGFTLMAIFGLVYRQIPDMGRTLTGKLHFWLFQIGALLLLIVLYLIVSETVSPATFGPVIMLSELIVLASLIAFAINLFRHA
ncbi:MAG: Cytochrome C and Quinol oxidase polypeptide I [Rhodobacteraceae bacterium HLUCCA12]|nr:MAG: Cytochrome C and Quinol oxidase polypeptide I [Rhodobacteraceae bacterium HLUCCA12]